MKVSIDILGKGTPRSAKVDISSRVRSSVRSEDDSVGIQDVLFIY